MKLKAEGLSWEAFSPFGTYLDPADCGPALGGGTGPVRFHPDRLLGLFEHSQYAALSPLFLEPRPFVVDTTEIHVHTEELFGGFFRDVVFHAGPAGGDEPDLTRFRAFHLPAGWWVRLKRGVWHHAPFVTGREACVGFVVLPPATYTADCHVVSLPGGIVLDPGPVAG
ncbi:MAG: ureidoglycolate lyase [Patescibacteria group bacterium]